MSGLTFGEALRALKQGKSAFRTGWNARDQWIRLQVPDDFSKMTLPYLYIRTVDGEFVPWAASQTDALAEDWQVDS